MRKDREVGWRESELKIEGFARPELREGSRLNDRQLFYSITVSFDLDQCSVMNQAINHGRSKGIVIVKDSSPVPEGPVGGHDDGATFIPVGDDLEEEFRPLLIHGEIAELIEKC